MKPDDAPTKPQAHQDELEVMALTRLLTVWALRTRDTLQDILDEDYFDHVISHGLRPNDRIEVVANVGAAQPEHATLAVDRIKDGKATVRVLTAYNDAGRKSVARAGSSGRAAA